jgi:hypothetical protein
MPRSMALGHIISWPRDLAAMRAPHAPSSLAWRSRMQRGVPLLMRRKVRIGPVSHVCRPRWSGQAICALIRHGKLNRRGTAMRTIRIDRAKRLCDEPKCGHNRYHPDIAPLVESSRARRSRWKRTRLPVPSVRPRLRHQHLADAPRPRDCRRHARQFHRDFRHRAVLVALGPGQTAPGLYGRSAVLGRIRVPLLRGYATAALPSLGSILAGGPSPLIARRWSAGWRVRPGAWPVKSSSCRWSRRSRSGAGRRPTAAIFAPIARKILRRTPRCRCWIAPEGRGRSAAGGAG